MAPKKVLIINTVGLDLEGMTTVIYNYTAAMDRTGLDIHFCATEDIPPVLKNRFSALGTLDYVCYRKADLMGYLRDLSALLRTKFDVVHIHGNSGTMLIEVLLAKLHGVKTVIIHNHSTQTDHPFVNRVLKAPMMRMADHCIACSRGSGQWLYGSYPHKVLNNAVDLPKFRFSAENREKYREEFGVKEEFFIGHVGHFTPPKNHFFLLDIFYEFHKLEPSSKLLLIGVGPRLEEVQAKAAQLGLQDAVIFAGSRNDVPGIYSALDLFLLPSAWEGLPLVLLEAQANGLPALVSDVVTQDAKCTDLMGYKALDDGARSWAEEIREIQNTHHDRTADTHGDIAARGFDIHREAQQLRKLYLQ